MKQCVKTQVFIRRVQRHPISQKAMRHSKRIVRITIPGVMNEVIFHHAQLNMDEVLHVTEDTFAISILGILIYNFVN